MRFIPEMNNAALGVVHGPFAPPRYTYALPVLLTKRYAPTTTSA